MIPAGKRGSLGWWGFAPKMVKKIHPNVLEEALELTSEDISGGHWQAQWMEGQGRRSHY